MLLPPRCRTHHLHAPVRAPVRAAVRGCRVAVEADEAALKAGRRRPTRSRRRTEEARRGGREEEAAARNACRRASRWSGARRRRRGRRSRAGTGARQGGGGQGAHHVARRAARRERRRGRGQGARGGGSGGGGGARAAVPAATARRQGAQEGGEQRALLRDRGDDLWRAEGRGATTCSGRLGDSAGGRHRRRCRPSCTMRTRRTRSGRRRWRRRENCADGERRRRNWRGEESNRATEPQEAAALCWRVSLGRGEVVFPRCRRGEVVFAAWLPEARGHRRRPGFGLLRTAVWRRRRSIPLRAALSSPRRPDHQRPPTRCRATPTPVSPTAASRCTSRRLLGGGCTACASTP